MKKANNNKCFKHRKRYGIVNLSLMTVDLKLLDKQICDLLVSNINEDSRTGLHNLLGEIYDNIKIYGSAIIHKATKK